MNEEFNIEKLILKFRQAIYLHKSHLRKSATENGLYDGQLPILEYIIKNDGCTQTDIAKFMNVTSASVATSVKRMENSGLIKRSTDTDDMRYNRLSICEDGLNRAKECRNCFNRIDRTMFSGLTEEERRIFCDCLDKMIKNLS